MSWLLNYRSKYNRTIYYLLTIDPDTEPEEIEESLSLHGIPADIRVSLSAEVGVGLDATPGQVDGDLLQVGLPEGQGKLIIVHQGAVGHVQGTRTSQRGTRWKRYRKISITVTEWDLYRIFFVCVCLFLVYLFVRIEFSINNQGDIAYNYTMSLFFIEMYLFVYWTSSYFNKMKYSEILTILQ